MTNTRTLICEACGKPFEFERKRGAPARYCSDECRADVHRAQSLATYYADLERNRERGRERMRELKRTNPDHQVPSQDPAYRRAKRAGKMGETREYECAVCGEGFIRERKPGRPPTVCSPECRAEDNRRRAKGWYHGNPGRVAEQPSRAPELRKAYYAAWYQENREREMQRSMAYARGAGREGKRARDSLRSALTRGGVGAELFTLGEIFERDGGWCYLCDKLVLRPEATMDHVIPVTRGGPHTRANVRLAHRGCNARKSNRPLEVP